MLKRIKDLLLLLLLLKAEKKVVEFLKLLLLQWIGPLLLRFLGMNVDVVVAAAGEYSLSRQGDGIC